MVWSALYYVGNIAYLKDADASDFISDDGRTVRLNAAGNPTTPYSLDSANFIAWLFASRGLNLLDRNYDITWDAIKDSSLTQSNLNGMLCPGDIIMNTSGTRGGVFLYYAHVDDPADYHKDAYVIEMASQGYDESLSIADINLDYSQDLLDVITQQVGCVSISKIDLSQDYWRIRPVAYQGKTYLPGSNEYGSGAMNLPTTSDIIERTQNGEELHTRDDGRDPDGVETGNGDFHLIQN